jgi:hypothetical protein
MKNNIVPGTWVSSNWCFLIYEHPEDAVVTYIRWLSESLQNEFFASLTSEQLRARPDACLTALVDKCAPGIVSTHMLLGVGRDSPELAAVAAAAAAAAVAAAFESKLAAVASDLAARQAAKVFNEDSTDSTNKASNVDVEMEKVLKELNESWHSNKSLGDRRNACFTILRKLVRGGHVSYTNRNQKFLVVDKMHFLSIPLIKVLYSIDDKPMMGWIMLLPTVEKKLLLPVAENIL